MGSGLLLLLSCLTGGRTERLKQTYPTMEGNHGHALGRIVERRKVGDSVRPSGSVKPSSHGGSGWPELVAEGFNADVFSINRSPYL